MLTGGADEWNVVTSGVPAEIRSLAEALRLAMIHLGRQVRRHDPAELSIAQVSGLASVVHHGHRGGRRPARPLRPGRPRLAGRPPRAAQ